MKRLRWVLVCLALVAGLAACSDDDGDDDDTGDDTTETTEASGDAVDAGDTDELIDEIAGDLDIRASGLETALGAEVEVVDESTLELTFDEGSVDVDSIQACAVVTALLEEGETATLIYPDGQETCD